jgi:hypothetical protein
VATYLVISPALAFTNRKFRLSGPHAYSNDIPQMDEAIDLEVRTSRYCKEGGKARALVETDCLTTCFHIPSIPPLPPSSPPATSAPVCLFRPQHGHDLGKFPVKPCGTKLNEQDALSSWVDTLHQLDNALTFTGNNARLPIGW